MIWRTITGIVGGALQDGISYLKATKERQQNYEHQINLEKVRSENKVKEFQAGIEIAKEETKQAEFNLQTEEKKTFGIKAQTEGMVGVAEEETVRAWYDNLTKASQYIIGAGTWVSIGNFFIATARPVITYLLGFLMFWIVFNHQDFKDTPQWLQDFITMLAFQFEATVSFWFYRRGTDKMREVESQKKK